MATTKTPEAEVNLEGAVQLSSMFKRLNVYTQNLFKRLSN